ncbi:MAG: hypothetical protein LBR40_04595 [Bacilli bacterium]|jgi:hypothetical protein|nr:hypothetical protein [Bacilli bacterium]
MKDIIKLIDEANYEEALHRLLKMEGQYLYKFYCLFELKKFDEIVFLYNEKKNHFKDNRDEIMGYYIIALMKSKNYFTAIDVVNQELDLLSLEDSKYDYYKNILLTLYNLVASENKHAIKHNLDYEKVKYYLLNDDYTYQENMINQLSVIDIDEYIPIFKEYFVSKYSSYLKSELLLLLINKKCDETFLIFKNNLEYEVVPSLLDIEDFENILCTCVDIYSNRITSSDYLENCIDVFTKYSYLLYPTLIEEDDLMYRLAVVEAYVYFLSDEELLEQFEEFYGYDMLLIEAGIEELNLIFSEEDKYCS